MRGKIFLGAGLMLAATSICPGQRPSATSSPSNWQLSPPFELRSSTSAAPASSPSPASASTATAPMVQTAPTQTSRDRNATGKAPYVEGSVWVLTFIKTKSGLTDDYFKSISASLKPVYEEEKKQRLILDYKI